MFTFGRRVDGIHPASFEQGEIGPYLFHHACLLRLEGLVSKHRESVYRGGRSDRLEVDQGENPEPSGFYEGDAFAVKRGFTLEGLGAASLVQWRRRLMKHRVASETRQAGSDIKLRSNA